MKKTKIELHDMGYRLDNLEKKDEEKFDVAEKRGGEKFDLI